VTNPTRIRGLMLENLFSVFNIHGIGVALVRDGQIAELHTLLTAQG
jgi:hypothetical protein